MSLAQSKMCTGNSKQISSQHISLTPRWPFLTNDTKRITLKSYLAAPLRSTIMVYWILFISQHANMFYWLVGWLVNVGCQRLIKRTFPPSPILFPTGRQLRPGMEWHPPEGGCVRWRAGRLLWWLLGFGQFTSRHAARLAQHWQGDQMQLHCAVRVPGIRHAYHLSPGLRHLIFVTIQLPAGQELANTMITGVAPSKTVYNLPRSNLQL